jgi:hypothetical protein
MLMLFRLFAVVAPILTIGGESALAFEETRGQLEEKLKAYDSETVDAARSYMSVLDYKSRIDKMMSVIAAQMTAILEVKNPTLSDPERKQFLDIAFHYVVNENVDLLEDAWILDAVGVYSKEELLALRDFYASPVGLSITRKPGQMTEKVIPDMTTIMKNLMPRAFEAAQSTMRSKGVDVKF